MKKIILILGFVSSVLLVSGQDYLHPKTTDSGFQTETEYFMFFNHFWLNAYHFLYNAALDDQNGKKTLSDYSDFASYTAEDEKIFREAIQFYQDSIVRYDLRRSGYLFAFKRWVVQYGEDTNLPMAEGFEENITVLNNFKKVYQKSLWQKHFNANEKALKQNIDVVVRREEEFVEQLSDLCKAKWQAEKIRVDLSFNSKRDIPYTTTRGATHIVMDSKNTPNTEGEWLELLLHEASHNLIKSSTGFVGGTIKNACEVLEIRYPRVLWHAYLFYFSGHAAREILLKEGVKDYELYMFRLGVLRMYHPLLEKHLLPYIKKEMSLGTATENFLHDYKNLKK